MTGALADAAAAKGATHWLTNVPEDLTKAGLRLQLDPHRSNGIGQLGRNSRSVVHSAALGDLGKRGLRDFPHVLEILRLILTLQPSHDKDHTYYGCADDSLDRDRAIQGSA